MILGLIIGLVVGAAGGIIIASLLSIGDSNNYWDDWK